MAVEATVEVGGCSGGGVVHLHYGGVGSIKMGVVGVVAWWWWVW